MNILKITDNKIVIKEIQKKFFLIKNIYITLWADLWVMFELYPLCILHIEQWMQVIKNDKKEHNEI